MSAPPQAFWTLPPATRQAIIDAAVAEQAAAERRRREFSQYVSAVASREVNRILDDLHRQYPTAVRRPAAAAPQPKPDARSTGFASFGDPKLWRYI